ncbi:hypothetical protein FJ546_03120 [Mesorhizobium sp. B2-4-19]|uniref:hypothetical protein n=1 Tax=Mesorhizobium sp. B2-4-19 TaxID=2589930 RepID=UPI00112869CE|nr:hypothetical protein [Mesorhizobium sp. B2-4-19]TPK69598.1 hypothetical protein FJ546_03120 [Mesorhizobium sp. B2-4-19]
MTLTKRAGDFLFPLQDGDQEMPQLHARGLELVLDLLAAADHLEKLRDEDLRSLLRETATVLADLLERDIPKRPS